MCLITLFGSMNYFGYAAARAMHKADNGCCTSQQWSNAVWTYCKWLLTKDMFAMIHHEDAGIPMRRVNVGNIHNIHIWVLGQCFIVFHCSHNPFTNKKHGMLSHSCNSLKLYIVVLGPVHRRPHAVLPPNTGMVYIMPLPIEPCSTAADTETTSVACKVCCVADSNNSLQNQSKDTCSILCISHSKHEC